MVAALPRRRLQVVAQAATTVDLLSGGRVVLALGVGVDSYGEYSLFDEPASDNRARARALDAGIELLVPMLRAGRCRVGGRRTTAAASAAALPDLDRRGHSLHGGATAGRSPRVEGLRWSAWAWSPETVTAALAAGGSPPVRSTSRSRCAPGDPAVLAAAGTTWCIPELGPADGGRRAQPGSCSGLEKAFPRSAPASARAG